MGQLITCLSKVLDNTGDAVTSVDLFGSPINIKHNKNDQFKTKVGGVATMILFVLTLMYTIYLIEVMITKDRKNFSYHFSIRDLSKDHDHHFPGQHGFDLAIGFRLDNTSLLDTKYLQLYELEVSQKIITNTNGILSEQNTPLQVQKCEGNLPHANQTLLQEFNINQYVCIANKNYSIGGDRYSSIRKSISISLKKCDSSKRTDCKTTSEIDQDSVTRELEVLMIDSYFHLNNINDPVQTFLTQEYFFSMQPNFVQEAEIFLTENKIEREDDYTLIRGQKSSIFYTTKRGNDQIFQDTTNTDYTRLDILLDSRINFYSRDVFTILDVLSSIGGLYTLFQSFFGFIIGFYTQKMFYYSILSKCYTYDVKENSEHLSSDNKVHNMEASCNDINPKKLDVSRDHLQINQSQFCHPKFYHKESLPSTENYKKSEEYEGGMSEQVNSTSANPIKKFSLEEKLVILEEKVKNIKKFKYTRRNSLYGILCCFKCKKLCKSSYQNYQVFQQGIERYSQQMDISNIVSSMRRVETLLNIVLTDQQKELLRYIQDKGSEKCSSSVYNQERNSNDGIIVSKMPKSKDIDTSNEKLGRLINDYKHKSLTKIDTKLLNQICPNIFGENSYRRSCESPTRKEEYKIEDDFVKNRKPRHKNDSIQSSSSLSHYQM
ncbi:unnamed protein product [Moneuplotes crassus]|uniref:Uncharacterized protein n=1 Tax=Euplotes crassus TaxID=5936 RepID=A0AAD1XEZ6_EUPCR|nr:unnamed protein product [Moneuplotes crassus]